ncbi:MAG: tetratricopeptide repeat protein [Dehalococcoidia bacterium]|nr:tetratricopeptide repeat protein [Dehalococcoidia bacterium]
MHRLLGEDRGRKEARRLRQAGVAFQEERFQEARTALRGLAELAPEVPEIRELYGLTLYRLGRWKEAAVQLEAFRTLSGSTEQHPVLTDCYRALGRYHDVDALWAELREVSPSAALVVEGRIVVAGALADRGRLSDAVRTLEQGWRPPKKPREHHLRRAYALADLYERSGDVPRARELFRWVQHWDPELGEVSSRLRALGART